MIRVRQLLISPGHNYFGRHGQAAGAHPLLEVPEVECVAGHGLRGDRFFDFKENYKGQITFFAAEVFERMQKELGLAPGQAAANTRRNVVTQGVDLNSLIGQEFAIQGVRFAGTEECQPCYWMNAALGHERAEAWLQGNGGLRARILSCGILRREG